MICRNSSRFLLILVCSLSLTAAAQAPARRFWRPSTIVAVGVTTAIRAVDGAQTCYGLARGAHERWMPTQSCAALISLGASGEALQTLAQWRLGRRHPRLAAPIPWLSTAPNVAGIFNTCAAGGGWCIQAPKTH